MELIKDLYDQNNMDFVMRGMYKSLHYIKNYMLETKNESKDTYLGFFFLDLKKKRMTQFPYIMF